MTRGIRGTYVYACKPNLRKYLSQFMGQHIVPIRVDYIDLTAGATETQAPDDPFDGQGTASESDADAAEHSSEVTVGAILKHKVFGRGTCTFLDTEHGRITVDFSGTSKMFAWPSSRDNGILIPE